MSITSSLNGASASTDSPIDRTTLRALFAQYTRPDTVPHPAENAFTRSRRELGKLLFFDTRLSGSQTISCASCHSPDKSYGDGLPRAIGASKTPLGRRTPTVLNTAYASTLFWDGRAESLEQQALGPVQAAGEMNLPLPEMTARLNSVAEYRALFKDAYGTESITAELVGKAIAQFERTVNSTPAPFDKWVSGDERAVSESAKRGFVLFNGKANCASCHSGWRFTDDSFHDIGIAGADSGRAVVIPGIEVTQFAFKTPTLRNAVERAPYMHDGSERTIEAVIDLYDAGGRVKRASLSPLVKPLGLLPKEKRDLAAFLRTLSSRDTVTTPTRFPR